MAELDFTIPFEPFVLTNKTAQNITGQRYARWMVFSVYAKHNGLNLWLLRCNCGTWRIQSPCSLLNGRSKSCGCLHRELSRQRAFHGESRNYRHTVEYSTFLSARARCMSAAVKSFKNYGGRGIEFRFGSFKEFYDCLGRRPSPNHSLDRINNDGHYEPGNVRWATRGQQLRNTRRNNLITFQGRTLCIAAWAEEIGISDRTLRKRLANWTVEDALTTPKLKTWGTYDHRRRDRRRKSDSPG